MDDPSLSVESATADTVFFANPRDWVRIPPSIDPQEAARRGCEILFVEPNRRTVWLSITVESLHP
jgi:hypothetical protein